jgi:hypothetical protein
MNPAQRVDQSNRTLPAKKHSMATLKKSLKKPETSASIPEGSETMDPSARLMVYKASPCPFFAAAKWSTSSVSPWHREQPRPQPPALEEFLVQQTFLP